MVSAMRMYDYECYHALQPYAVEKKRVMCTHREYPYILEITLGSEGVK